MSGEITLLTCFDLTAHAKHEWRYSGNRYFCNGVVEVSDVFVPIGGDGVCHGFGEKKDPVVEAVLNKTCFDHSPHEPHDWEHMKFKYACSGVGPVELWDTPEDSAPQHVTHYEVLPDIDSLLYDAWGLIANAYGGDWNAADDLSPGWRDAAEKWRDRWHETLNKKKALERDRRVAALVGNGTIGLDDMMRIIKLYTEEDSDG